MKVSRPAIALIACLAAPACGASDEPRPAPVEAPPSAEAPAPAEGADGGAPIAPADFGVGLGARIDRAAGKVRFRVRSANATRITAELFAKPRGEDAKLAVVLARAKGSDAWEGEVPLADVEAAGIATIFYGYRAWGPNFVHDPAWKPGSTAGFVADVDDRGNRFNPNKLALDPYALEMTHDPWQVDGPEGDVYGAGDSRDRDSGRDAPKGVVLEPEAFDLGPKPKRSFADDVIYEVHVRGLTKQDPEVPADLRGTYLGAARKAKYLKSLGVTAIELLPVHETQNDTNDARPNSQNYWGYSTLSYFAPDRRFAADKSPGGATREVREMVRAFHAEGIKVIVDVVYNHTGEGNKLLSWRALDNASYYELGAQPSQYANNNGVGPNVSSHSAMARDMVIDSLAYWAGYLGVDGFRFDLASVLGDACAGTCFRFDKMVPDNMLNRAVKELPGRPPEGGDGVDLIAEPWGIGMGTYQVGGFPVGWAEWNGQFRDTIRKAQNRAGVDDVIPGALATRLLGSSDLYRDDGRTPAHTVNFVVAHDGFTLRDLYSYDQKNNDQPPPFGPSDGGSNDNISWNQGGVPGAQKQAGRTAMLLLAVSAGAPMILGGDEMWRTQRGNNNTYNLDNAANWLDWAAGAEHGDFRAFTSGVFAMRHAHPALRPKRHFDGTDHDGNGLLDVALLGANGEAAGDALFDAGQRFLALRFDGEEAKDPARSVYVAYHWGFAPRTARLPAPAAGRSWRLAASSATGAVAAPGAEPAHQGLEVTIPARSVVVLVER